MAGMKQAQAGTQRLRFDALGSGKYKNGAFGIISRRQEHYIAHTSFKRLYTPDPRHILLLPLD